MVKKKQSPPKYAASKTSRVTSASKASQATGAEAIDVRSSEPSTRWTFLTNHTHVLAVLDSNPQLVLRQVALQVGITERAVQRIVQDLEEGGFIRRERVGRNNQYQVLTDEPLRHPIESHRKVGDLLDLIKNDRS